MNRLEEAEDVCIEPAVAEVIGRNQPDGHRDTCHHPEQHQAYNDQQQDGGAAAGTAARGTLRLVSLGRLALLRFYLLRLARFLVLFLIRFVEDFIPLIAVAIALLTRGGFRRPAASASPLYPLSTRSTSGTSPQNGQGFSTSSLILYPPANSPPTRPRRRQNPRPQSMACPQFPQ